MELILTVTHYNRQAPARPMSYTCSEAGGSIGRKAANAWVLPDAQRFLSGQHAVIEFCDNSFFIRDTSTNGVFLNGNVSPIGKNNTQRLQQGDQLRMGQYEIAVAITEEAVSEPVSMPEAAPIPDPTTAAVSIPDDWANEASGGSEDWEDDPFDDLFDAKRKPKREVAPEPVDAAAIYMEMPAIQSQAEPETPSPPRLEPQPEPEAKQDSASFTSLFAALQPEDKLPKADNAQSQDVPLTPPTPELSVESPQSDEFVKTLTNQPVAAPPETVDPFDDLFADLKPQQEPVAVSSHTSLAEQDFAIPPPEPNIEHTLAPQVPAPFHPQRALESEPKPEPEPVMSKAPEPVAPVAEEQLAKVESAPVPPQQLTQQGVATDNAALDAFLRGAGIDDAHQRDAISQTQDMHALGQLFRLAIQGTLTALHSRAEIKNAMRMDVTTIQRRQNNPLKFAITVDDALPRLLSVAQDDAYLSAEQALQEAYDDICAHQLAVMSGVQAALKQVLKRFDPDLLVARLEKHNPISANIPIQRQATLWKLFAELYSTLEAECEDDFQRLFGMEFAKAYDAQMANIKQGQAHG